MMTLPCCYKVLVFMLVAILLLFDLTNFAKADNFADKDYNYQYPDYQSSTYIFFITLVEINITNIPETNSCSSCYMACGLERSARKKRLFSLIMSVP